MSKSIEDYRNIIKILKLQLLKVRQQNSQLSHTLGIASENETSSFTPKINHYAKSQEAFSKNIIAFLNFAHRCQLIGLTPQMIFRIADKKRDKKVGVNSFLQILKRVKLHLNEVETNQLINLVSMGSQNIVYEEYLQCLSAFQINSQKYPAKSTRTYVQLCLLKFGKEAQSYNDADKLYKQMNRKEDLPYLSFENYATFVKNNLKGLNQIEITAVFVGLDVNSECQIQKSIFRRQIGKVFSINERGGVNLEEEFSAIKESKDPKENSKNQKQPPKKYQTQKSKKEDEKQKQKQKQGQPEYKYEEQTGEQAGNKAKKPVKKASSSNPKAQAKLSKGEYSKILGQFKKLGIQITSFIDNLISSQKPNKLIKSFTINDFAQSIKSSNKDASKKKILQLFRQLDTELNGTIDSSQLLKLWLRGKQLTDSQAVLYRLLYRHFRQTQFLDPLQKFKVLGIQEDKAMTEDIFTKVFVQLNLFEQQIKHIMAAYQLGDLKIKQFAQRLKADGKPPSSKKFTKMDRKVYDDFKNLLQKINAKRKNTANKNMKKLMRPQTVQDATGEEYWQTVFTDEWACWQYCLEVAYKLQTFWKDHQFGPTKSNPAGIKSIIGNQSNPPPGLPEEQEIIWLSYEEILAKQKSKEKIVFMEKQLSPNDVVQGKLGDCWFVSSLSIIANNETYIKGRASDECKKAQQYSIAGVNPYLFKFFLQYGLYVFKYYKKFQPVFVVVDDLFPVQKSSNELLFAKSPNPGMQWVAFLQKSYAKLHHAYSNMISGDIAQGLNDLTNALPIKQAIEQGKPENIQKIRRLNNERQMMGCSITAPKGAKVEAPVTLDDQKCGLFYGHAYSILQFLDLKTKEQVCNLIRVRNPWGHGQWILDWSDKPKDGIEQYQSLSRNKNELAKYYQIKIQQAKKNKLPKPIPYEVEKEDGQFLMKFQDFNKVYTNLFTGYNLPNKYECQTIRQKWDEQFPSGICSMQKSTPQQRKKFVKQNHQYLLTIKQDDTDVLMYIIQQDGRLYRGQKYPYKQLCNGTMILSFNLTDKQKSLQEFNIEKSTIKNLKFELRRQVNMWYKFKAGKYAIIPCKMKNDIPQSQFQFRIYYDKNIKIEKIKGHNNTFSNLKEEKSRQIDATLYGSFIDLLEKYNK